MQSQQELQEKIERAKQDLDTRQKAAVVAAATAANQQVSLTPHPLSPLMW